MVASDVQAVSEDGGNGEDAEILTYSNPAKYLLVFSFSFRIISTNEVEKFVEFHTSSLYSFQDIALFFFFFVNF